MLQTFFQPVQDDSIYIEVINGPMPFQQKATAAEYKAGLDLAIENGWLELHESGTFVRARTCLPDLRSALLRLPQAIFGTRDGSRRRLLTPRPSNHHRGDNLQVARGWRPRGMCPRARGRLPEVR